MDHDYQKPDVPYRIPRKPVVKPTKTGKLPAVTYNNIWY
jgi:hypothetical protein